MAKLVLVVLSAPRVLAALPIPVRLGLLDHHARALQFAVLGALGVPRVARDLVVHRIELPRGQVT